MELEGLHNGVGPRAKFLGNCAAHCRGCLDPALCRLPDGSKAKDTPDRVSPDRDGFAGFHVPDLPPQLGSEQTRLQEWLFHQLMQ